MDDETATGRPIEAREADDRIRKASGEGDSLSCDVARRRQF
jgi:hypothetical protein